MEHYENIDLTIRRAYGIAELLGHSAVGTSHLLIALTMEPHEAWENQALTPE